MVLVTGAGGWLGAELTKQLLEKDYKVRALNNIETEKLKELKSIYKDKLEIVIGDICNDECIKTSLRGINEVFHLAAKVHYIPTNKEENDAFYNVNTKASEKIFKQCIENKVSRVIFFSSVSVYESSNKIININSRKNPNTAYGDSKLQAENIANQMHLKDGLPITIIEPVTVYGEGDVGNFKKLENLVQKGICIRFGNGKNRKTVIYYKDLIKMVINISEDSSTIGKTIICGTEVLELNQINNILKKRTNKKVVTIIIPTIIYKLLIKIFNVSVLKKIRRKIMALTQNNEFDISMKYKYISEYKKFEEFENEN
jgi:nucleoside-diphosphate-sugar epimerase